jgi:hypothetical protein
MIFANGSGFALSLGMSASGTAVSAAAGGALISNVLNQPVQRKRIEKEVDSTVREENSVMRPISAC